MFRQEIKNAEHKEKMGNFKLCCEPKLVSYTELTMKTLVAYANKVYAVSLLLIQKK